MSEPHGVILRIVKDPVIETQFLQEDDGLTYQVWSAKREDAFVFDTHGEADQRAAAINALGHLEAEPPPHVYAAVVVGPRIAMREPAHSNGHLSDKDFLTSGGRQVLREEMHRLSTERRRRSQDRASQLEAELRADDLRALDEEVTK